MANAPVEEGEPFQLPSFASCTKDSHPAAKRAPARHSTRHPKMSVFTNHFHMPRTCAIFRHVFQDLADSSQELEVDCAAVDNLGMSEEQVRLRGEREARSLVTFESTKAKITNTRELHRFLFQDHMAYATKRAQAARTRGSRADDAVASTY